MFQKKGENLPSNLEREKLYSENYACPIHGSIVEELSPRLFSFNSPYGACPDCHGIGYLKKFTADRVIPDQTLPVYAAIAPHLTAHTGLVPTVMELVT